MSKAIKTTLTFLFHELKKNSALHTQIIISAFFAILLGIFYWSSNNFWKTSQEPRLYKAAETQAQVLAESQSAVLIETLERTEPQHLEQALKETVQKMLIVEDPAIGERFIRKLVLEIDYDTVNAPTNSLDLKEGDAACDSCFHTDILLTNRTGEILGIASFSISGGYFQTLINEMRPKFFAESNIVALLMIVVWLALLIMFHRLHKAKNLIEASDQAKTRFMANVTHELRTPLNAILGYTQLYKQDQDIMLKHRQGIETISRSADHLLLMINDILEFSRANEETLTLHPTEIDLQSFLNTLVEMTKVRTRLKGLEFIFKFANELPAIISADEKRLRQILLNLLGNAVKFTETGRIVFTVEKISARDNDSAKIRFNVEDTGIGIDRKQLKAIFIPFHQLENAITQAEGTGLGLTISQRLLNLMGSNLQVASKVGQGSAFWFNLELPVVGDEHIANDSPPVEETAFKLPAAEWIAQLKEQCRRHNVLGIRELVSKLMDEGEHQEFLAQVQPFIQQYRFKQLLDWLEQQSSVNSNNSDLK